MRNPFRYGLTTNTNYSAYLFIVTTPGKLTGWIGLPTESTASIITALKSWLTQTELLGRTQSVRFIRTDAGTAFTSAKFITECTNLGIKVEAAAPEHQEMNGICEAKWREVHNTANTLLNNARLGGAFFHHAHAYAVHIINVCPAKNVTDINGIPTTPYQFSYKRKPNLGNFRVFGCPTFFKRYEPTFRNKIITYKQQLQRASRGIFLGFPENSAGWLIYSPDQPQSLIITRDAYFDEDFNSALCFDSKPFAGAVPIRSHFNPNGLRNTADNSEPATFHQTGSAADLGNPPSHFLDASELPTSLVALPDASHNDDQHGPTPPTPHQVNYIGHQHCHSNLQKMMTLYFQECNEDPPSIDPIHTAMLTIDNATISQEEPAEPNLIDHGTFILGQTPSQADPIIPVKLVLKAKQTATGKLEKLKARLVARGDLEKRLLKKAKAAHQQHLLQQRQEIANAIASATPKVQPIEIPQPFEDTWSPCASSRGVKLLLSTICASRRTLKSADFIGAYLQAKVIGRHFVKLPLEYAFHFPEYAKFFGKPLLLDKGIYGLVYSGKYWNIEFSEWLYSQGFIQSQSEPSYFVRYDKHNQWLRLLFFVDDMLYAGSNDSIEKQFEDSVKNRFDVKFLGPAQWFLQMRIHQHQDSTYTLDQHRYVLNTLQRYDPNSEFPERDTPFPPDYTFSKENRPVTEQDIALVAQKQQRLPFAPPSALSSTWHTTPELISSLLSANLLKPVLLLEFLTSVPSPGSSATYAAVPTMHSSSTLIAHPILSMRSAYNIAFPMLILLFSLMPAGKTAQTLAAQPLAT
ncbi:Reverse transcriptase (RNA-dependent DNA polymerase) [Fragilaria crotonensis]|nr:Reverse transcriptase (RNA-dependent DNA polymerase) [Fragilaria crotonensis]